MKIISVINNRVVNPFKVMINQMVHGYIKLSLYSFFSVLFNKTCKGIRTSVKVLSSEIKDKRFIDRFIFKISNFSFGLELVCRIRNWLKVGI